VNIWLPGGFFGTWRELKDVFVELGFPDFWTRSPNFSTLKLKGVLIRWWPASGRVLLQGEGETIRTLRDAFLTIAREQRRTCDPIEYRKFALREAQMLKKQNIRRLGRKRLKRFTRNGRQTTSFQRLRAKQT
jgi:hypothetical protein